MAKLIWDDVGKRFYETGVDKGVLFPAGTGVNSGTYPKGYAWNGLNKVTEKPSGAEATAVYADNIQYLNLMSVEKYGATIEAYTFPEAFDECNGAPEIATGVRIGQQTRKSFGLVWRTAIGNDVDFADHGYKLHLVYGAIAAPSEKAHETVNESPTAMSLSWEISTTPVSVPGFKPTASLEIDSTTVDPAKLAILEGILFGTDGADARLPLPAEIVALIGESAVSALALSSIVPVDDTISVTLASNIVLTFNNKISKEAVVITSAAGLIVPVTKSWDATGKILTIDPVANLSISTVYIVTIGGVIDVYNQALDPVVKNFTTANS